MKARRGQEGFTLIDATITLLVSVLMLYTLHSGTQTSLSARKASERIYAAHLQGMDFMERVRKLPFGQASDPKPSAAQLQEFFDDDDDLGTITLSQLKVNPTAKGYQFKMASKGLVGTWEVKVTDDLDGDGNNTGPREGRADLLKILVFFEDKLMFESLRTSDPSFTIVDTTADYLNSIPAPPAPPRSGGQAGGGAGGNNGGSNGGNGGAGSGSRSKSPLPPGGGGGNQGSNGGSGGAGGGGPGADKAAGRGGE